MAQMQVDLVAVERAVWSGPAQMVVARTVDGDIGVMPGHAPLLAQLREGFAARIIAPDGTVLESYSAMNPDGHVQKTLDAARAFQASHKG